MMTPDVRSASRRPTSGALRRALVSFAFCLSSAACAHGTSGASAPSDRSSTHDDGLGAAREHVVTAAPAVEPERCVGCAGIVATKEGAVTLPSAAQEAHLSSIAREYGMGHLTERTGTFRAVLSGCAQTTHWRRLEWDATTSASTGVSAFVRAAASLEGLEVAPRVGPLLSSPAELSGQLGGSVLEVELVLRTTDAHERPEVRGLIARYVCEGS